MGGVKPMKFSDVDKWWFEHDYVADTWVGQLQKDNEDVLRLPMKEAPVEPAHEGELDRAGGFIDPNTKCAWDLPAEDALAGLSDALKVLKDALEPFNDGTAKAKLGDVKEGFEGYFAKVFEYNRDVCVDSGQYLYDLLKELCDRFPKLHDNARLEQKRRQDARSVYLDHYQWWVKHKAWEERMDGNKAIVEEDFKKKEAAYMQALEDYRKDLAYYNSLTEEEKAGATRPTYPTMEKPVLEKSAHEWDWKQENDDKEPRPTVKMKWKEEPAEKEEFDVTASIEERDPFDPSGLTDTRTSAVPDNLRKWNQWWVEDGQCQLILDAVAQVEQAYIDGLFAEVPADNTTGKPIGASGWKWGSITGVIGDGGFCSAVEQFCTANTYDADMLDKIATCFEAADRDNKLIDGMLTLDYANQIIGAGNVANFVKGREAMKSIDDLGFAGVQPSSGYAVDPVNVASGALCEVEKDIHFGGVASSLGLVRTYNAGDKTGGVFGAGWFSVLDERLEISDETVSWRRSDGCLLEFPAKQACTSAGCSADSQPWWIRRSVLPSAVTPGVDGTDSSFVGFVISDNAGAQRFFTMEGVLVGYVSGLPGDGVRVVRDDSGRVRRLVHSSGREVSVTYGEDGLVSCVRATGGQEVTYSYHENRLVSVHGVCGVRSYEWDEASGVLARITDEAGVVLMDNTFDECGHVVSQKTPHGRTAVFEYLPSGVTLTHHEDAPSDVIGDAAGERSRRGLDTWISDSGARLNGVVDSHGEKMSITRDRFGNPVSVVDREGRETLRVFDNRSRLSLMVSPEGVRTSMEWDEWDRCVKITREIPALSPLLREASNVSDEAISPSNSSVIEETTLVYSDPEDMGGVVVRTPMTVTDSEGVSYSFEHDGVGRVVGMCGAGGYQLTFSYDEVTGELVSLSNAVGQVVRFAYDEVGRITSHTSPSGATTTFAYNTAGDVTRRVEPDGAVYEYVYEHGRLVGEVVPDGGRTIYAYGGNGEVESVTDPLGRVTSFTYDDQGNTASVTTPGGDRWATVHDSMSRLTKILTPTGEEWAYGYSANGEIESVTSPTGTITSITKTLFNGGTQISATTSTHTENIASPVPVPAVDPSPVIASEVMKQSHNSGGVVLDAAGRPVRITSPDGSVVETRVYDKAGRLREVLDGEAGLTRYEYNSLGLVSKIINPDETETVFTYDKAARLVKKTSLSREASNAGDMAISSSSSGVFEEYEYDLDGRITRISNSDGVEQGFVYDVCGRLTSRTTPGEGITSYVYDVCGRVVSVSDGLHGTRCFSYDLAGQLVSAVDGNGNTTTYTYTANGQVESVTAPDGGVTSFEYDCYGNTTRVTDPLGRSETRTYDPTDSLTGLTRADKTGLLYDYDGAGRLLKVDNHKGQTLASYDYDTATRTVTIADNLADSDIPVEHTLTFDRLGRLVKKTTGGTTIAYTYNKTGEREAMTITRKGQETPTVVTYGYTSTGQLEEVTHSTFGTIISSPSQGSETSEAFSLERDTSGRISRIITPDSDVSYTYDTAGQLVSLTDNTTGETTTYTYDACGRITTITTSEGITTFTYNPASELTSRILPDGTVITYTYDAAGRRVSETRDSVLTAQYEWDSLSYLARLACVDGERVEEVSLTHDVFGNLATVTTGEETTSFLWDTNTHAPSLLRAGNTDVFTALGHTAYGRPQDNTGWLSHGWRSVRSTNPANPWALPPVVASFSSLRGSNATEAISSPSPWNILLGGSIGVCGLELMGARTYDPSTHGFLTTDPLPPIPGTPYAANPYEYAGNNPLALLDPLGLRALTDQEMEGIANNYNAAVDAAQTNNWDTLKDRVLSKEFLIGAGLTALGFAAKFIPIPGLNFVVSGALTGAGMSMMSQKLLTGEVDRNQVIGDAAMGAVTGGVGGWVAKSGKAGATALRETLTSNVTRTRVFSNATYGMAENTVSGAGADVIAQGLNIYQGKQDGYNFTQTVNVAGTSGASGFVFGGAKGEWGRPGMDAGPVKQFASDAYISAQNAAERNAILMQVNLHDLYENNPITGMSKINEFILSRPQKGLL